MLDEDLRAREDDALSAVVPADAVRRPDAARGSMAPKVEAAARFADAGGTTMIGALHQVDDLLAGRSGTAVEPGAFAENSAPRSGSAPMAEQVISSRIRT
jgi:hypothetical protein